MALDKQLVGVPIRGLSFHADSKNTVVGELGSCANFVFKRTARGGAELRKRYGGAALAKIGINGSPTVASGRKLATYDSERLLLANDTLFSYSPNFTGWISKGSISGVGLTVEHVAEFPDASLAAAPRSYAAPDIAISGNLMAVAWTDTVGAGATGYLAIFDMTTGNRVFQDTIMESNLTAAGWVRVVALATSFMVVAAKGSTNQITANTIAYSNLSWSGGSTAIIADLNASCKGDVTRNGTNDSVLIAYHSTTPNLKVLVINSNKTAGASATVAAVPDQAIGWLDWDFSDGVAYFGYCGAAIGLVRASTPVGAAPAISGTVADAAAVAARQLTGFRTGTTSNLYIEVRAAPTYNTVVRWWSQTTGGAVATLLRSVGIGARIFKVTSTGKYYLPFTYESPLQNTYFVGSVDGTGTRPTVVARALYGLGGGLSLTANVGGCPVLADGLTALVPVMRLSSKPAGTAFYGICLARVDFGGSGLSAPKRVGDSLHLPGGAVRAYSGEAGAVDRTAELGFYLFPETPTLAQGGGGALTLLGSYQYVAVYAFTDSKGQVHRSAPSAIASIVLTGGNQTVTGTIPTLRVTEKLGGPSSGTVASVELYRTQASGTTFYRVPAFIVGDDPTVDTVAFTDVTGDGVLGNDEELYTTGKVLPHICPPSAKLMESWRSRLFLAGTENPLELWPSNEYAPGEGVSFSDGLVITMEADGGPITALCEMDDRLLIFKRNSVYALGGNGPTLTGDGNYEQPVRVCSFVGAIGQGGVVKTRDGVMFQSARGIYMYTRGGETLYVGAGIEIFNAIVVTGACVLENEEQVRFVNASGSTFVYHYGHRDEQGIGFWTQFTNQAAVDTIVWNGTFVYLKSDGTVVEETVGAYTDPGAVTYNASVQLQWLNLTQFFGRFRLYGIHVLYEPRTSFTINHRVSYDFLATPAETGSLAVTATLLAPLVVSTARRRVSAVLFYLDELSSTEGFRLSGIGLEVGLQPGARKQGLEKFFG